MSNTKLKKLIGHHMNSPEAQIDCNGFWPGVDCDGIINGWFDGDSIPDDAIMADWDGRKLIIVDGNSGFGAILDGPAQIIDRVVMRPH